MLPAIARKKITILAIISMILLGFVGIKLTYLTLYRYRALKSLATELWERSFPLSAPRGLIQDRNGKSLAINQPSISVAAIPFQIKDKEEAARLIAPYLKMKEEKLYQLLSKRTSIVRIHPEGKRIDEETALAIESLHIDGIYLLQDNTRYYPYEESMASLLGFVGIDNQGLAGIESYYDTYLKGKDGTLNFVMM